MLDLKNNFTVLATVRLFDKNNQVIGIVPSNFSLQLYLAYGPARQTRRKPASKHKKRERSLNMRLKMPTTATGRKRVTEFFAVITHICVPEACAVSVRVVCSCCAFCNNSLAACVPAELLPFWKQLRISYIIITPRSRQIGLSPSETNCPPPANFSLIAHENLILSPYEIRDTDKPRRAGD